MMNVNMDEKHAPDYTQHTQRKPTLRNRVVVSLVLICVLAFNTLSSFQPDSPQQALVYAGEHIPWHPCGALHDTPLECSSIQVPMDHFNPTPRYQTFTIPLIRMRGGTNASKNLLLNPGGPGGSGFDFLYRRGELLQTLVGDGFHLLSFDPRGVNSSTPSASCYHDAETRRTRSSVPFRNVEADSPEVFAWADNFVRACPDTMREYAAYINTPQTAADMNSILDAVGQAEMFYWGFSYGSLLGQTYASLFPERSARVVIDGVVDQFEWYQGVYEAESLVDADAVLEGFFDACVAEKKKCSLSALGASTDEVRETVLAYMSKFQEQPLSVYIDENTYGLLHFEQVWYDGVLPAMLKPATWAGLADALYSLIQGNATDAFLAYGGEGMAWDLANEAYEVVTLNDGLTGPEHWPQDRQSILDELLPLRNQSRFSAAHSKIYYMKQKWTVPKKHAYVPRRGVQTAHPLLILSTTYDPVCPLVAARSANGAFEGSRIVEVEGYGHCSIAVASVCVARHLREFLYEGKLPDEYTRCEVDSPYFVRAEEDGLVHAQRRFEDAEEQRIHLAQLELARVIF
jgi:pimeloyl-ACP methyl ester carboxylesterase